MFCHLSAVAFRKKVTQTKDDINKRDKTRKSPGFLFTRKQLKAEPWREFSKSSRFSGLKICLRVDEMPNRTERATFVKTPTYEWTGTESASPVIWIQPPQPFLVRPPSFSSARSLPLVRSYFSDIKMGRGETFRVEHVVVDLCRHLADPLPTATCCLEANSSTIVQT